jgi:futalosine hydrolase
MYILLAAATTREIQPAAGFLESSHFRLGSHETGILTTGVGSLPATYALMRGTAARRPDLVIQGGIAGCFTGKKPGELVVVREELLADLGVWEGQGFKTLFDLGLSDRNGAPFSNGLLVNPYKRLLDFTALEAVRSITVNEITTDQSRIAWLQQNVQPVVESMEGGALHYVCLQEKIPFLQLRSISNDIGIRDKTQWDIKTAIDNLNEEIIALMKRLVTENASILIKN